MKVHMILHYASDPPKKKPKWITNIEGLQKRYISKEANPSWLEVVTLAEFETWLKTLPENCISAHMVLDEKYPYGYSTLGHKTYYGGPAKTGRPIIASWSIWSEPTVKNLERF